MQADPSVMVRSSLGLLVFRPEDGQELLQGFIYLLSQFSALFSIVMAFIAYNSESSKRTMINTVSYRYRRLQIFFSKLLFAYLLAFAFVAITLTSYIVVQQIVAPIGWGFLWQTLYEGLLRNGIAVVAMNIAIVLSILFINDRLSVSFGILIGISLL